MLVTGVLLLAIGVLSFLLGLTMVRNRDFGDRSVRFWKGKVLYPMFSNVKTDTARRLYGWGYAGTGLLFFVIGIVLLLRS